MKNEVTEKDEQMHLLREHTQLHICLLCHEGSGLCTL